MESQQNEQVQYCMRSRWVRNRSKFMTFATISDGSQQHSNLVIDSVFILFNAPVPAATLRCSLSKWLSWRYLVQIDRGYSLTGKGYSFMFFMNTHCPGIVQDWRRDLELWRQLPKDRCRTPDGTAWLPSKELIIQLEMLKPHRVGSPRKGTGAGRPRLSNTCLVCGSKYRLDIETCPICRLRAERATRMQQVTPAQVPPELKPAVKLIEQQCPTCDGPTERVRLGWYCPKCDITIFSTGG
jgi:hypothetical protein